MLAMVIVIIASMIILSTKLVIFLNDVMLYNVID